MAAGKKNAARLKAYLVFLDESGFLMAPLVRRSWSKRRHTPILNQRGRSHEKVSAIAALCIPPSRRRVRLYFRLHPDDNINALSVIAFLRCLGRQLGAPLVVIWDRLQAHRAKIVKEFLSSHRNIRTVFLPSYAPELNPCEYGWAYLKTNPLANAAFLETDTLATAARSHGRALQRNEDLLRSFVRHSNLPLRLR